MTLLCQNHVGNDSSLMIFMKKINIFYDIGTLYRIRVKTQNKHIIITNLKQIFQQYLKMFSFEKQTNQRRQNKK